MASAQPVPRSFSSTGHSDPSASPGLARKRAAAAAPGAGGSDENGGGAQVGKPRLPALPSFSSTMRGGVLSKKG